MSLWAGHFATLSLFPWLYSRVNNSSYSEGLCCLSESKHVKYLVQFFLLLLTRWGRQRRRRPGHRNIEQKGPAPSDVCGCLSLTGAPPPHSLTCTRIPRYSRCYRLRAAGWFRTWHELALAHLLGPYSSSHFGSRCVNGLRPPVTAVCHPWGQMGQNCGHALARCSVVLGT